MHEVAPAPTASRPTIGVERLHELHRDGVKAHLLRLSGQDRRMRFCHASTDEEIGRYVARIDFETVCCFGVFDRNGSLIALAEAIPYRAGSVHCLEAAFSTDAAWRSRGLAKAGFEAIKAWADGAGFERIVLHCDARNAAMRALLRSIRAATSIDRFEVDAAVLLQSAPRTQAAAGIGA